MGASHLIDESCADIVVSIWYGKKSEAFVLRLFICVRWDDFCDGFNFLAFAASDMVVM